MANNIELTVLAEDADEKALHKFIDDLQRLKDLPSSKIDVDKISASTFRVLLRFPLNIFDRSVSQFMAMLFGEIPFMRAFGKARFEDLTLPAEVYTWFQGPAFGAASVLERFGAAEPPLLVAIIKPSLDLEGSVGDLEQRMRQPVAGGFHAAKDDEMQGDFANLSLRTRLELASRNRGYIPAVNLDDMSAFHKVLQQEKLGMVLMNPTIVGFPALHELRKHTKVPMLGHLSMHGIYATSFSHRIYGQLHRLFGCDAFISPIGETHYYRATKAEELEIAKVLTDELPIAKTLPMLTGGGSMSNLASIMTPYETAKVSYGIVLGGLIFNSDKPPQAMAEAVVQKVAETKQELRRKA